MKVTVFCVPVLFCQSFVIFADPPSEEDRETVLDAIMWVESKGDPNAKGDLNKETKIYRAKGAYQIWDVYWKDSGVPWEYEKDVWDPEKSREVCRRYLKRYAKDGSLEKWARVHNGGPNGMKNPKTEEYWKKVKRAFEKMKKNRSLPVARNLGQDIIDSNLNLHEPGGITLSMAIAQELLFPIEIRAMSYDSWSGSLVFVGPVAHYAFDAGFLLTALRLGCNEHVKMIDAVSFSLDPHTGAFPACDDAHFVGILKLLGSINPPDRKPPVYCTPWNGAVGMWYGAVFLPSSGLLGVQWKDPSQPIFSTDRAKQSAVDHYIQSHFPRAGEFEVGLDGRMRMKPFCTKKDCGDCQLGARYYREQEIDRWLCSTARKWPQSKLRFFPEWLNEYRYGEILYRADLALKELAGALRADSSRNVTETRLPEDYPPPAALDLFCKETEEKKNIRLWYEYKGIHGDVPSLQMIGLKGGVPAFLGCPADHRGRTISEVSSKASFCNTSYNLEDIFPYLNVRKLEGGEDLPERSPHEELSIKIVNADIQKFVDRFPEIQKLVNLYRASFFAWKLAQSRPGIFEKILDEFPEITDFEKAQSKLPETRDALVAYYEKDGDDRRGLYLVSGGVGMNFRDIVLEELSDNKNESLSSLNEALDARPQGDSFSWEFRHGEETWLAYSIVLPGKNKISGSIEKISRVTGLSTYKIILIIPALGVLIVLIFYLRSLRPKRR